MERIPISTSVSAVQQYRWSTVAAPSRFHALRWWRIAQDKERRSLLVFEVSLVRTDPEREGGLPSDPMSSGQPITKQDITWQITQNSLFAACLWSFPDALHVPGVPGSGRAARCVWNTAQQEPRPPNTVPRITLYQQLMNIVPSGVVCYNSAPRVTWELMWRNVDTCH